MRREVVFIDTSPSPLYLIFGSFPVIFYCMKALYGILIAIESVGSFFFLYCLKVTIFLKKSVRTDLSIEQGFK